MRNRNINLTKPEARLATYVGVERILHDIFEDRVKGMELASGEEFKHWDEAIHGAGAECAWARFSGEYWDMHYSDFNRPDFPPDKGIRQTDLKNGGLIVRPGDHDDHRFILITGRIPNFFVVGWLPVGEAKQEKYFCLNNPLCKQKPCPCNKKYWRVPQSDLISIEEMFARDPGQEG